MKIFAYCISILILSNTSHALDTRTERSKILLVYDFSGPGKVTSNLSALGADVAFSAYPKLGRNHELIRVDMGTDVKTIGERVAEAVSEHKPVAIFGAINSNHAFVISEIAEKENIPYVAPVATHVKLTNEKSYTFRACFDDSFQASKLADFIYRSRKLRKGLIVFNETQSYAIGVRDIVAKRMEELGAERPDTIAISSEKDITDEVILKIKNLNPQYIVLPSYQIEAASILSKLVGALPKTTEYFGTDSWGGGRMFDKIFETTKKTFKGFYSQHWSMESKSEANLKFIKRLKSFAVPTDLKFEGTAMNSPIALGYDGMTLILEAIGRKKKAQTLISSMNKIQIEGASGLLDLRDGPTPKKGLFIFEITGQNEKFHLFFK